MAGQPGTSQQQEQQPFGEITFEDFTETAFKLFRSTGFEIFVAKVSTKWEKIMKFAKRMHFVLSLCNQFILVCIFAAFIYRNRENTKLVTGFLPHLAFTPIYIYKVMNIFWKREKIAKVLNELKETFPRLKAEQEITDTKNCHKKLVLVKRANKVNLVLFGLSLIIQRLLQGNKDTENDQASKIWEIVEYDSLTAIPVLVWLAWLVFNGAVWSVAPDLLMFAMTMLVCMKFAMLQKDLENFGDGIEPEMKDIKKLIERHEKVLQISCRVEKIFSSSILYTLALSSVLILTVAFLMTSYNTQSILTLAPYLFGALGQFFLVSYLSQKLRESSADISDGAYNCEWYRFKDMEVRQAILAIMQRAQQPSQLAGVRLHIMAFEYILAVSASAYAFYSLLKNIYKD